MRRFRTVRASLPIVLLFASSSLSGCEDAITRQNGDVFLPEVGPRDGGSRDSGGPGDGGGTTDDGGGIVMSCTPSNSVKLFETLDLVGGEFPFAVGAGVDGLVVASAVRTDASYPSFERVVASLSMGGVTTAAVPLSAGASDAMTSIAFAPSGSGTIALFNDDAPRNLFVRTLSASGAPTGSSATQITSTSSSESKPQLVQLTSGYAAIWLDTAGGATTAMLSSSGAIVGASHDATGTTGSSVSIGIFGIGATAHAVFLSADNAIKASQLAPDGTISGSSNTLSMTTANANFAVAGAAGGAGLIYESVGFASEISIRFRAINAGGTASIGEKSLTAAGEQGYRPAIAAIAGGYLVLFRYVPAVGTAKLRLMALDTTGQTLAMSDIVDGFPAIGRYAVVVSPDADAYVVYQQAAMIDFMGTPTNGAEVRALQVECQ